jgi:GNAT superfamily N-acetyltransferase
MLAAGLESAGGWKPFIEPMLGSPRFDVVGAFRDGHLAGFLAGERMDLPLTDFASQFVPPHSISVPVEAHAVALEEDQVEVYRAMYAELAALWTANGYFVHRVGLVAGDPEAQEAWVSLEFGRHFTAATRPTGPVEAPKTAGVEVHRAAAEDIDVVMTLADQLAEFHWRSPIFWPFLHSTDAAARQFNLQALEAGETPYFVGYQDGRPVGMQTFLRPGFTPPVVEQEGNVYLYEGVVDESIRGGGVGNAILKHTMEWAREAGYERCTLHFASPNPSGGPFWLGHGFVPVEHTMERRIDERVAWARL